ncbi:MAG: acylphosphatase [Candidatus Omnitrophica bacterium]|nr:acylphosphatase [Candidatus Omnitrophota bacterium]
MKKLYHIIFKGRVQGVGFRYTTRYLAKKYNLCGWVMNLDNGDVELEVEGKVTDLDNFLDALKEEFRGYIRDYNLEEAPFTNKYNDFQIRF